MPHGWCYLWNWRMIAVQVAADSLIALAYCLIPYALWDLRKRVNSVMLAWFSLFIFSCGMTHVMDIAVVWRPIYWEQAAVKILTAVSSLATALLLFEFVNILKRSLANKES